MTLQEYIDKYYGGVKARFARAQGISPQHLNDWFKHGYVVSDNHVLYSMRRQLIAPPNAGEVIAKDGEGLKNEDGQKE